MNGATSPEGASLRLDKWLWFARLARTRSLAAKLCGLGLVSVGETVILKPHHPVRIGDWIVIDQGRARRRLQVRGLGERRGPAAAARLLYDEPQAPERLGQGRDVWTPLLDDEDWEESSP